ncbi:3',5'-cyclic-nucleotide phosphodiesterase [Geopsychrobacter electrodiphilus]|uniref:3',5'-cyclic-nucleotide phosphodiesterase n=1 Tax=Geopsychrobacter electrodiphilus TaxID=225196 RepID=UPI00037309C8|nr:3',5'-cyclic-nucleotide phosphodiesterase [Geopsychrobacter electrodiphilus]
MQLKVLGSSGSRAPGFHASCLLINQRLLLDAGTVSFALSLEEQAQIDDVLLTHAHLDHMVDLAFLADNMMGLRTKSIRVWAPEPVLAMVSEHLLNNKVWPDFTRLPSSDRPVLRYCPLPPEGPVEIAGLQVSWRQTNHPVHTVGYLFETEHAAILYSGDTSDTEEIWQLGRECTKLRGAFIETSFPNRLDDLAIRSGHMTPAMLEKQLVKLDRDDVPVYIFHMKQQYLDELQRELSQSAHPQLTVLRGGEIYEI